MLLGFGRRPPQQQLRPYLQRGKRRTQLMRGLIGKGLFMLDRGPHPFEQAVQRGNDRRQVARHGREVERLQFGCGPVGERRAELLHRRQPAPQGEP